MANAAGSDSALVMSHPEGQARVATVELYRKIEDAVRLSGKYNLVDSRIVQRIIAKRGGSKDFGPIPVIRQSSFHKAHPEAASISAKSDNRKKNTSIEALQAALDTEALKGALIVDCLDAPHGRVRSCGLYYYDRVRGHVTASNRKHFRVGIEDANKWAESLVLGLSQGMRLSTERREKAQLQEVLSRSMDEENPSSSLVETRGIGQSVSVPGGSISSVPGVGLTLGMLRDSYTVGISAEVLKADLHQNEDVDHFDERSAGLAFGVQARALDSLFWDLGFEAAYALRSIIHYDSLDGGADGDSSADSNESRLKSSSVRLSVAPGMMWKMSDTFSFGSNIRASRYMPLSTVGEGSYADGKFNSNSVGMSIRVSATF